MDGFPPGVQAVHHNSAEVSGIITHRLNVSVLMLVTFAHDLFALIWILQLLYCCYSISSGWAEV